MPAVIVSTTGAQYVMIPEAVDKILKEEEITSVHTNGSQSQFNFREAEPPFAIVTNNGSDDHAALLHAWMKQGEEKKRTKTRHA